VCYLGESGEVDGQQTVGGFLALVRREDNGAILFKGDRGLTSVHDLQLWTKGVKHDLHNKDSSVSTPV
jgi:hypothetical protein